MNGQSDFFLNFSLFLFFHCLSIILFDKVVSITYIVLYIGYAYRPWKIPRVFERSIVSSLHTMDAVMKILQTFRRLMFSRSYALIFNVNALSIFPWTREGYIDIVSIFLFLPFFFSLFWSAYGYLFERKKKIAGVAIVVISIV